MLCRIDSEPGFRQESKFYLYFILTFEKDQMFFPSTFLNEKLTWANLNTYVSVSLHNNMDRDNRECDNSFTNSDGGLLRNIDGYFFETLNIFDPVKDGDEDVDSGLESSVELSHPFDDPGLLLRHKHDDSVQRGIVAPSDWGSLRQRSAELFLTEDWQSLKKRKSKLYR